MGTMQVTIPGRAGLSGLHLLRPDRPDDGPAGKAASRRWRNPMRTTRPVSNMQTQVDEQENGLFSISFSYSAGATEGSRRDFTLSITKRPRRACLQPTSTATVPAIPRRSSGWSAPSSRRPRTRRLPDRAGVAAAEQVIVCMRSLPQGTAREVSAPGAPPCLARSGAAAGLRRSAAF